ncbi:BRO-N domain-containing protein [Paenilisteria rocourtiae]|uniref:Prophage antirepressor-like protein n=1 Tax=Listeria rocourtiae TaxID=647910 RepID=A0A4R6ZS96_9LIST|nr:BRO family protein [Listeria rocourtiae]EUJ44424.1 prophage Sa05 BRO domain-containing protein [Listeria rocourtiae FSL F6-920]TDR55094.1 prophage antirepressor-like protein [Listeria rocourtiae]
MKTEIWNDHKIRFVNMEGEWWAVLSDIARALSLRTDKLNARIEDDNLSKVPMRDSVGRLQETSIVNEFGIYDAIFSSKKAEAKEFKRWVFNVIKQLRQSAGLEGFEVFRMLDKEHQKESMQHLRQGLKKPVRVDFIKANVISNKAVSTKYGFDKMIKKADMTPEMLLDRQGILESTVELMRVKEKFGLGLTVSDEVYRAVSGEAKQLA